MSVAKSAPTKGLPKEKVAYDKPTEEEWEVLLALPWPTGLLQDAIRTLHREREGAVLACDVIWTSLRFQSVNLFLRRNNSPFRLRIRGNPNVDNYLARPWS